jgi:hypothetical protein
VALVISRVATKLGDISSACLGHVGSASRAEWLT